MSYEELRFIDITKQGTRLGTKKLGYPVLSNGIVYKVFDVPKRILNLSELYREKEKIMLLLTKLNLQCLTKIRSILTWKNKPYGYTYEYNASPLMKDYLETYHPLSERLNYISEIIKTHEALLQADLTYIDYHSGNFLMDKQVIFIDIDSIINKNAFSFHYIQEYLFTLILSLFLNYDITDTPDLAPYYNILCSYFNTPHLYEYDLLDLNKIFAEMTKKDEASIPLLVRKIYETDVKSQL